MPARPRRHTRVCPRTRLRDEPKNPTEATQPGIRRFVYAGFVGDNNNQE
jgi:hypothetical protein